MPAPRLETERLILRPPAAEDAEPLYDALFRDPDVCRYTGYRIHRSAGETEAFLREASRDLLAAWCYERRDTGEPVGFGGLAPTASGAWELGYLTAKRFWAAGYTREAAERMLRWAAGQGQRKFIARHAVGNTASGWVLKRLGFRATGRTTLTKLDRSVTYEAIEYRLTVQ